MQKPVRFLRFLSMIIFLIILMYVYAGLPKEIVVFNESGEPHHVLKDRFFYWALGIFFVANVLIFASVFFLNLAFGGSKPLEPVKVWLNGLAGILNLFFSISVLSIGAINASPSLNMMKSLFYGGLFLVVFWLVSLVYLVRKAVRPKAGMHN